MTLNKSQSFQSKVPELARVSGAAGGDGVRLGGSICLRTGVAISDETSDVGVLEAGGRSGAGVGASSGVAPESACSSSS